MAGKIREHSGILRAQALKAERVPGAMFVSTKYSTEHVQQSSTRHKQESMSRTNLHKKHMSRTNLHTGCACDQLVTQICFDSHIGHH